MLQKQVFRAYGGNIDKESSICGLGGFPSVGVRLLAMYFVAHLGNAPALAQTSSAGGQLPSATSIPDGPKSSPTLRVTALLYLGALAPGMRLRQFFPKRNPPPAGRRFLLNFRTSRPP